MSYDNNLGACYLLHHQSVRVYIAVSGSAAPNTLLAVMGARFVNCHIVCTNISSITAVYCCAFCSLKLLSLAWMYCIFSTSYVLSVFCFGCLYAVRIAQLYF